MKLIVLLVALGVALASAQQQRVPAILQLDSQLSPDGQFQYVYRTEDGISADAQGTLENTNSPDGPAQSVTGQYSYTGPDGQSYTVKYVADQNGYRASGAHLPQAPPIPQEIQRSLEFNARNPQPADDQQDSFQSRQSFQQRSNSQQFQQPQQQFQQFRSSFQQTSSSRSNNFAG